LRLNAKERRRQRQTQGAIYDLSPRERRFVMALVGGCSDVESAIQAGYRSDRAAAGALTQMRKPIVRAAVFHYRTAAVPEGVDPYAHELSRLALIPEDLLADKPTWQRKIQALELTLKLQNKFPGHLSGVTGGAVVVNILVEAAKKRAVKFEPAKEPELIEQQSS
jgi:hypothetical protein